MGALETVDIEDRPSEADIKVLRSIIRREEMFDDLFVLQPTFSMRGFTLRSLSDSRAGCLDP